MSSRRPEPLRDVRRDEARRRTRRTRRVALGVALLLAFGVAGAVIAAPRLLEDEETPARATASAASDDGSSSAAQSATDAAIAPPVEPLPPTEGAGAQAAAPTERQAAAESSQEADTGADRSAALAGLTVNLDPGHNGGNTASFNGGVPAPTRALLDAGIALSSPQCDTSGAATNAGYPESAFNLDVARRAKATLEARGATVTLTRTSNATQGPCTAERAAIGNRADVAVSIHADGGPPGGRGFHVIVPGELQGYTDDVQASSAKLGTALRDAMRATGMPDSTYLGSNGLDVRTNLVGLVLSDTPKVFLESGNMRNAADAALLSSPAFRQRIAEALADAVVQWRRAD